MKAKPGRTTTDEASTSNLSCPACGDSHVNFHSELAISIGTGEEKLAIFLCSASHTFMIPYRSLSQPGASTRECGEKAPSQMVLIARADKARVNLRLSHRMGRVLLAQQKKLSEQTSRRLMELKALCMDQEFLVAQCQESLRRSRSDRIRQPDPLRRPYGLPIQ